MLIISYDLSKIQLLEAPNFHLTLDTLDTLEISSIHRYIDNYVN